MICANPACGTRSNDRQQSRIFFVDFLGDPGEAGECQIIQRRVIWLCDACTGIFAVETWRPPGPPVRPSGSPRMSFPRVRGRTPQAQSWS
jgi:hypothetical protein